MGSQAETILGWLNAIKTDSGQKKFLEFDFKRAIQVAKSIQREQVTEADVKLLRLLRNCVPLGEGAVTAILEAGLVPTVVLSLAPRRTGALVGNPTAAPYRDGVDTEFLAACAQLLANLANSGASGAAEIWLHCFPSAFLSLIAHPSAQVHQPATLALYACCRRDIRRSRELCALPDYRWSSSTTATTRVTSGSPSSALEAAAAATVSTSIPSSPAVAEAPAATVVTVASEAARGIWEALLGRLLVSERRDGSRDEQRGGGGDGPSAWTCGLLCGCVVLRQGLLGPLLTLLLASSQPPHFARTPGGCCGGVSQAGVEPIVPDAATGPSAAEAEDMRRVPASTSAAAAAPSEVSSATAASESFSPLWPVLLHVVAQELYDLQGGGAVDIGGWADHRQCSELHRDGAAVATGALPLPLLPSPPPPPQDQAAAVARSGYASAAVGGCTIPSLGGLQVDVEVDVCSEGRLAPVSAVATADPVAAAPAAAATDDGPAEPTVSTGGGVSAGTAVAALPPMARPVASALLHLAAVVEAAARCLAAGTGEEAKEAAVLEAGLEVLKSATQREDGCRAIAGGDIDLVEWLLCEHGIGPCGKGGGGGVLALVLGMLGAMQPAAALRHQANRRGGGGGSAPTATTSGSPTGGCRPVVELPYTLKALAAGFPTQAPYMGYRGDLVSVLANGAFRRLRVVSELLSGGGLELLLAQTHLDEHSPLAREWALWGVRNMCEASEEVQGRIAGLKLQTAVETPELQQLGLKLELDKATGKLKVSKTEAAKTLLECGQLEQVRERPS